MTSAGYQPPKLNRDQAMAVELELFSWLVPLRSRDFLLVREAAKILRMSEDFIVSLIDLGKLEAIGHQAKGESDRQHRRITVRSFLLYVITSSNGGLETWREQMLTLTDKLDVRSIDFLIAQLTKRRERLSH